MFILSEKIAPPSHVQIFNVCLPEDVRLKKCRKDDNDLWVQAMIENLAGFARRVGMGKTQRQ